MINDVLNIDLVFTVNVQIPKYDKHIRDRIMHHLEQHLQKTLEQGVADFDETPFISAHEGPANDG